MWSLCWKILWEVDTVICETRPWTHPSVPLFRPSFTSKTKQTEQLTSCTSVPNNYSQYFSTQCPIVYYTCFTEFTRTVKSVFWNTHVIHTFLNTPPFTDLLTWPSTGSFTGSGLSVQFRNLDILMIWWQFLCMRIFFYQVLTVVCYRWTVTFKLTKTRYDFTRILQWDFMVEFYLLLSGMC